MVSLPLRRDSSAISPTAHYTGHVWSRNGLSHPTLDTLEGRLMFDALQPLMAISGVLGGPTLETYLLARHRAIDELLRRAIEDAGVTQVIELACGMSARGWRFSERYGSSGLVYVEADLPEMASRKRSALSQIGSLGAGHRVDVLDALAQSGPRSLEALASELDRSAGLAIISEGLIGYLERSDVLALWKRIASLLAGFSGGVYLSDLAIGTGEPSPLVRGFRLGLSAFVRGRVYLHFEGAAEALRALRGAGFTDYEVLRADALGIAEGETRRGAGGRLSMIVRATP
jgi:O-methyltransferase involved in polyketide biosynthesis